MYIFSLKITDCSGCIYLPCVVQVYSLSFVDPSFNLPLPLPSLDYERVITHYIRQYKYEEALRVLRKKGSETLEAPDKVRQGVCVYFSNLYLTYPLSHVPFLPGTSRSVQEVC